jgi:diacylglycerol kinase (ATP)
MEKKFAFIINPNAGKKKQFNVKDFICERIPSSISFEILEWESPDNFQSIQRKIRSGNFECVVAVGGDGTVNAVASSILGSEIKLGILPFGSGNGLARTLGIRMNPALALQQLINGKTQGIDVGWMNKHPFFCTAGTGFDAHVGGLFAESKRRGFLTYASISTKEIFSYRTKNYRITIDGKTITRRAFLITVCNSGQWGNDIYICPEAKINDGVFHVSILNEFSKIQIPSLTIKLLRKKIHTASFAEIITGKSIVIECESESSAHADGEPLLEKKILKFEMSPNALQVIC